MRADDQMSRQSWSTGSASCRPLRPWPIDCSRLQQVLLRGVRWPRAPSNACRLPFAPYPADRQSPAHLFAGRSLTVRPAQENSAAENHCNRSSNYVRPCPTVFSQPTPAKRRPNQRPAPPIEPPLASTVRMNRSIAARISDLHERPNHCLNQLSNGRPRHRAAPFTQPPFAAPSAPAWEIFQREPA
jgi:hypothetical protein